MYTPFVVITLALLTGTGGGILRDVFVKEIPFVFRKEVYAVASIAGSAAFLAAHLYCGLEATMYICFRCDAGNKTCIDKVQLASGYGEYCCGSR